MCYRTFSLKPSIRPNLFVLDSRISFMLNPLATNIKHQIYFTVCYSMYIFQILVCYIWENYKLLLKSELKTGSNKTYDNFVSSKKRNIMGKLTKYMIGYW